jgi:hypothetical protein
LLPERLIPVPPPLVVNTGDPFTVILQAHMIFSPAKKFPEIPIDPTTSKVYCGYCVFIPTLWLMPSANKILLITI